ncbi:MAG: acyl-CoA dehydratase activase [Spirochaetaceae bacterium]|jgi:predicted CoA-substrate-specific enzyme activase|nr:acyl-CoA dehydratase activase [Spirochaetaceae bacterium]
MTGKLRGRPLAGIDCGSSFCKGVLLYNGSVQAAARRPTGWDMAESGRRILAELLAGEIAGESVDPRAVSLSATGYGREKISGAGTVITEISAHARGAEFLCPGVKTVIDIGGQDSKLISVENGRVRDFQMNDKCAAGSGRFLEMIRQRLDLDHILMEELFSLQKKITLNSTCVVFAESEIIGLITEGVPREDILGGAADSLARRIAALAGRTEILPPAVLTGGLSESPGLCRILSGVLGVELRPLPQGIYAGAIGAALSAGERQ